MWVGSPAEQRQLQYDLWGVMPTAAEFTEDEDRAGWVEELVTPMQAASTSQMLDINKCLSLILSGFLFSRLLIAPLIYDYTHRVFAGEF